ncbi:unnamed protein product [Cylicocyclus nassatus]|uniref:Uncharacterized protein n=1 Tax=Cylicocyclus nassatus TaxID=53992 RepID=A0AA36MBT3_CYLNA|nr:unnamed protein product [Cylicocyclus nassatus]
MEYLDDLTRERHDWRPVLFKCLQIALRDVRGYDYDTDQKKWIPNNRQAKRSVADLEDEFPAQSQQAPSQQAPSQQAPSQQAPSQQASSQQASSQQASSQQAPSQEAPSQAVQAQPEAVSKSAKPRPQRVLPVRRRIRFEDESP